MQRAGREFQAAAAHHTDLPDFLASLPGSVRGKRVLREIFGDASVREVVTALIFLVEGEVLEKLQLCFDLYDTDGTGLLQHDAASSLVCTLLWAPALLRGGGDASEEAPPPPLLSSLGRAWGMREDLDPASIPQRASRLLGGSLQVANKGSPLPYVYKLCPCTVMYHPWPVRSPVATSAPI
jgi:hypothetical protein